MPWLVLQKLPRHKSRPGRRYQRGLGRQLVGLYAIQLASVYGFTVVTTCSPRHADLVRSHGAKHVFDYDDQIFAEKIPQEVPPSLPTPPRRIALRGRVGNLWTVQPGKSNSEGAAIGTRVTDVLVWTAFLKDHSYGEFRWPMASLAQPSLCTHPDERAL
ncbi:hypothetical protein KXW37_009113 [Aspergillus fumigatus]|nr:hypothetical protein KXW37_009113 [Aspergillus fumigatus]